METKCPNCKQYQELNNHKIKKAAKLNEVKQFSCDNCGFSTRIMCKIQEKDRIVVFYAMSDIEIKQN
jgi:hypothetical protein